MSGSGKTHTLIGNEEEPGIIPRALEQIYHQYRPYISQRPILKVQKPNDVVSILNDELVEIELQNTTFIVESAGDSMSFNEEMQKVIQREHSFEIKDLSDISQMNIWVAFVEIYNENFKDLLNLHSKLRIISNAGDSYIKGLTWIFAPTAMDAYCIMQYGHLNASYSQTAINVDSSRSHGVFLINITSISKDNEVSYSNYKFCDLAGSERVKKAESAGARLKETQNINKSLMIFGRCLTAVHSNQKTRSNTEVVPVRESKFTLLIQAALTGRETLSMVVNLWPVQQYFDENMNVLNFSSIAKQIVVKKPEERMANRQSARFSMFMHAAITSPTRNPVDHIECQMEKERYILLSPPGDFIYNSKQNEFYF